MNQRHPHLLRYGIAAAFWLGCGALQAQAPPSSSWYTGLEFCRSSLRIPGRSLDMEGIHFTDVNASGDQAGAKLYLGYWIDPHFGIEASCASLGKVNADFRYTLPPAESGSGTTQVSVSNFAVSFQAAQRLDKVLLFARGGVQAWALSYDTHFRLSTGQLQDRNLRQSGDSFFWGAGAEWNFRGPWNLRLEGEVLKMDITDARVVSLGLTYRL